MLSRAGNILHVDEGGRLIMERVAGRDKTEPVPARAFGAIQCLIRARNDHGDIEFSREHSGHAKAHRH